MHKTLPARTRNLSRVAGSLILLLGLLFASIAAAPARTVMAAPLSQTIWLRANANNQYVSADQNLANTQLVANRASASGWEMFTVVDAGGGLIALRASNGLYVSADQNLAAYAPLVANRATVQGWEMFQWIDAGSGLVNLKSSGTGKFVSADQNRSSYLVADRATASGWETFTWGTGSAPNPTPVPTTVPGGRFAAPYVESWNNTSVNNLANATGNKHYTLAFIISNGSCTATWNGDTALSSNLYVTDVANLRAQGGDVIISFGGASGTELGQACSSVSALQAAYQSVITKYNLKWMDLDIESGAENDTTSITRRNQALHNLQAANPGLKVSYTLAVNPTGLPQAQLNLLSNAKANGVTIADVNVMAMDYGTCNIDMGQAAISAASSTRTQLSNLGVSAQVGVTPMIGVNDTTCENFTTANAQALVNYANANSYIGLLAYWAVGADPGNAYLNIFKTFH